MLDSHEHQGRIHAEFHPLRSDDGGAVTGRFSSSNPNLQNIPARGAIGNDIRSMFLPEEKCLWLSADWSQQEPRLMAHYAALLKLEGSDAIIRAYESDSTTDFHQLVAELSGLPRKQAKAISLGLAYGMGRRRLAITLGLSNDAADALMAAYNASVPWLQGLSDAARRVATERGVLQTTLGRKARFDTWEPARGGFKPAKGRKAAEREYGLPLRRARTHTALNRLIQGSAADMMKVAMVKMWEEYDIVPHMTIHDEVCVSVPKSEVTRGSTLAQRELVRTVVHAMKYCLPDLLVPMTVDVERGPNWGSLAPLDINSTGVVTEHHDKW
jgi:DNA polymerase I-like protein with 3'-5' exonuclease and polymerase domains